MEVRSKGKEDKVLPTDALIRSETREYNDSSYNNLPPSHLLRRFDYSAVQPRDSTTSRPDEKKKLCVAATYVTKKGIRKKKERKKKEQERKTTETTRLSMGLREIISRRSRRNDYDEQLRPTPKQHR